MNNLLNKFEKEYKEAMLGISERDDYHPEPTLWHHTLEVYKRAKETGDINLQIAALFHDTGKIHTYKEFNNSYGHESTSAWIVLENRDVIDSIDNTDIDLIYYLVNHHTNAQEIMSGKLNSKTHDIISNNCWNLLEEFTELDDMRNLDKRYSNSVTILHKEDIIHNYPTIVKDLYDLLKSNINQLIAKKDVPPFKIMENHIFFMIEKDNVDSAELIFEIKRVSERLNSLVIDYKGAVK